MINIQLFIDLIIIDNNNRHLNMDALQINCKIEIAWQEEKNLIILPSP